MIFLSFFIIVYALPPRRIHNCIHDQIIANNHKLTPINDTHLHRTLQASGFGPIRLYYIYNTTDISSSDLIGRNIIKIMDIIKSFWYHIIEVDYFPSLSFNLNSNQAKDNYACGSFQVSKTILDNPIPNKDFGVLI